MRSRPTWKRTCRRCLRSTARCSASESAVLCPRWVSIAHHRRRGLCVSTFDFSSDACKWGGIPERIYDNILQQKGEYDIRWRQKSHRYEAFSKSEDIWKQLWHQIRQRQQMEFRPKERHTHAETRTHAHGKKHPRQYSYKRRQWLAASATTCLNIQ